MREYDIKSEPIKFILVVWVLAMISYLVWKHAGTGTGKIDPMIVLTALLTLLTTKLVDWALNFKKEK